MLLLGLTGSIAMGKSHAVRLFRAFGVPVFDADAAVHGLFAPGGAAVAPVLAAFAGCGSPEGGIDRRALGARVLGDAAALRRLETIVHPLVRAGERQFLERQCRDRRPLVVLDIPLLLETGGQRRVDRVAVVSAHPALQRQRALRRPGMSEARLSAILDKQLPDAQKRRRADFVIPAGFDRGASAAAVEAILVRMHGLEPRAWPRLWMRHR
ncbi:dephospho-CoA kinase [Geminicoccaceae bacterium 1502E]|nr:dephospho-CoA kinase [Geminicoccaceae bacterium 1502E]